MEKLEFAEDGLAAAMQPFLTTVFNKFYEKREIWEKILSVLTEIDCLASFAILSGQSDTNMCRPKFIDRPDDSNECGRLELR